MSEGEETCLLIQEPEHVNYDKSLPEGVPTIQLFASICSNSVSTDRPDLSAVHITNILVVLSMLARVGVVCKLHQ